MDAGRLPGVVSAQPITVFLDRDGVINRKAREDAYVTSWEEFEFLPGTLEAFRLLADHDVLTIVVTNQRAVGRGLLASSDLALIHRKMLAAIHAAGGRVDAVFACEHDAGRCSCRKPATGLFLQARERFPAIDFATSLVIGDSATDLEAGRRLGCRLVLIGTDQRRGTELLRLERMGVHVTGVAAALLDAVRQHVTSQAMMART